jgi:hypothetical protein
VLALRFTFPMRLERRRNLPISEISNENERQRQSATIQITKVRERMMMTWVPLSMSKESDPVKVAEMDKPAPFAWWDTAIYADGTIFYHE